MSPRSDVTVGHEMVQFVGGRGHGHHEAEAEQQLERGGGAAGLVTVAAHHRAAPGTRGRRESLPHPDLQRRRATDAAVDEATP
ncbi:MAG TPA: hypothetical protein VIM10_09090 [Actinopolymorphaceae bacterium]|jgi:hypothetical protein